MLTSIWAKLRPRVANPRLKRGWTRFIGFRRYDPLRYGNLLNTSIGVDDCGFTLSHKGSFVGRVGFDDISEVNVYKTDLLTFDLVCCNIAKGEGQQATVWSIHEGMVGFDKVMQALEQLPGFRRDWYAAVVQPAFAENRTVVFRRAAPDSA